MSVDVERSLFEAITETAASTWADNATLANIPSSRVKIIGVEATQADAMAIGRGSFICNFTTAMKHTFLAQLQLNTSQYFPSRENILLGQTDTIAAVLDDILYDTVIFCPGQTVVILGGLNREDYADISNIQRNRFVRGLNILISRIIAPVGEVREERGSATAAPATILPPPTVVSPPPTVVPSPPTVVSPPPSVVPSPRAITPPLSAVRQIQSIPLTVSSQNGNTNNTAAYVFLVILIIIVISGITIAIVYYVKRKSTLAKQREEYLSLKE